jgi:hypothetical protein
MPTLNQEHLIPDNREQVQAASAARKSGLAQDPSKTISARVKVVNPLLTMGPSSPAHVLRTWDTGLRLKVHCAIFRGSLIQVRTNDKIVLARVQLCLPSGTEFEISAEIVETLLSGTLP